MEVYATGDAKALLQLNALKGARCWICGDATALLPGAAAPPRCDAALPSVPVTRIVGDYNHCAARLCHAMLKRLRQDAEQHLPDSTMTRTVTSTINAQRNRLQRTPTPGPNATAPSPTETMYISMARAFLSDPSHCRAICDVLRAVYGPESVPGTRLSMGDAFLALYLHVRAIWTAWRSRQPVTDAQMADLRDRARGIADLWTALHWQPTVWLHWTTCHMVDYMERHRTLACFSSIPTEARHRRFKRDVSATFHGYLSGRVPSRRAMANVMNLQALDAGLLLHHAQSHVGTEGQF